MAEGNEPVYYQQKARGLDMLLSVAPYVVGAIVVRQVGIQMGIFEKGSDTKGAAKFRALPYFFPEFATEVFKGASFLTIVNSIYDKNDLYRLEKAKTTLSSVYSSKGFIWDDETAAVNALKSLIKSKIDASIFAAMFLTYAKDDLISYLDTYLENEYQAQLYKWAVKLPLLTPKEITVLEKTTGRIVKIKGDTILLKKK